MTQYTSYFDVIDSTCLSLGLPDDWLPLIEYFYTDPPTEQVFEFSGVGAPIGCAYTTQLSQEDSPGSGTYSVCPPTTYMAANQQLVLNQQGTQDETLRFIFEMWFNLYPTISLVSKEFTIEAKYTEAISGDIIESETDEDPVYEDVPCTGDLVLQPVDDLILSDGLKEQIVLAETSNGDCEFKIELFDHSTGDLADPSMF